MTNSTTAQPESLHIVCPHCDAVNRVPSAKLAAKPSCGTCQKDLFTGQPVDLTSARFTKHIERSDIPVVVDFWATWCGPCRVMAPQFTQLAQQQEPKFRFVKVDVDAASDVAAHYRIQSIPTLIILKNGQEVARQIGWASPTATMTWLKPHMIG